MSPRELRQRKRQSKWATQARCETYQQALSTEAVGPTSMRRSRPRPSGGTTEARSSAGGGNWVQALSQALGHPDIRLSRQLAGPKEAVRGSLAPFLGWPLGVGRNSQRTVCYHFATQFGSTRRDEPGRNRF